MRACVFHSKRERERSERRSSVPARRTPEAAKRKGGGDLGGEGERWGREARDKKRRGGGKGGSFAIVRTDAIGGWNLAFGARKEQSSSAPPPPECHQPPNHGIMRDLEADARPGARIRLRPQPQPGIAGRRGEPAAGCCCCLHGVVSREVRSNGQRGIVESLGLEQLTVGAVAASRCLVYRKVRKLYKIFRCIGMKH